MMRRRIRSVLFLLIVLFGPQLCAQAPEAPPAGDRFRSWIQLQAVPSLTVVSTPSTSAFGFEWEVAPILYSFGMTRLVSPWSSFIVIPTARFSGSVELVLSGQLFTRKVGRSYFGGSAQFLVHLPLVERGEYLGLNLGAAQYFWAGSSPRFGVAGLSTLFGLMHFNLKASPDPLHWMASLEFRLF